MKRILTAFCVVLLSASAVRATTVDDSLGKMADDVKKYADSKNTAEVRLEGFRGVGQFLGRSRADDVDLARDGCRRCGLLSQRLVGFLPRRGWQGEPQGEEQAARDRYGTR